MTDSARHDAWASGDAYDLYMGRWSRRIAPRFLDWLQPPAGADWLDLGAGTGALSGAILASCAPASILAIEPSESFRTRAAAALHDPRVTIRPGDAGALPDLPAASFDIATAGLVVNFLPSPLDGLSSLRRLLRPGGTLAFYVWDYPGAGVGFMRAFWNAAIELDPGAADLPEGGRFPFCTAGGLVDLMAAAGMPGARATALTETAVFADFDDFWRPFTLGAGPAPGYCARLDDAARDALRRRLESTLPRESDGSIVFGLRAWGVSGSV